MARWRVRLTTRIGLVAASAALALACGREVAAPSAAAAPAAAVDETHLAVLPNNVTLLSTKTRLLAIRSEGEVAWELTIPDGDTAIAPVAVALNSVAYLRGAKGIHAVLPDGKWLWSKPLDGQAHARTRGANSPIAMSDSTVAVVVGDDVIRFDYTGAVRWRVTIPDGHVVGSPAAGMDGSLRVQTTTGVYSINPEGAVSWRRAIGT